MDDGTRGHHAGNRRTGWDVRSWALGVVGGAACGLVHYWAQHDPPGGAIPLPWPAHAALPLGRAAVIGSSVLGAVALPAFLAATARRLYALWGLLPVGVFVGGYAVDVYRRGGTEDLRVLPVVIALMWLVASGPVTLVRAYLSRKPRRAAPAAADPPPPGSVWPPPPVYPEVP